MTDLVVGSIQFGLSNPYPIPRVTFHEILEQYMQRMRRETRESSLTIEDFDIAQKAENSNGHA